MRLLHIDSSVLGKHSVSRQISEAVTNRLRGEIAGLEVTYRDLTETPLHHLSGSHMAARGGATVEDPATKHDISVSVQCLDEFLAADIVVIGAPMYNFTVPSQLKAWIDRILVAGKTFEYTAEGPKGLAGGKRIIIAMSRGGFYGPDTPSFAFEHLESYLRAVFGLVGITNPEFILAEGIAVGAEQREKAVEQALRAASELIAA